MQEAALLQMIQVHCQTQECLIPALRCYHHFLIPRCHCNHLIIVTSPHGAAAWVHAGEA